MTVNQMNFSEQHAFFAKLSNCAYKELSHMQAEFPDHHVVLHSEGGADVYTLENDSEFLIACRGTEPKQFSDVRADLGVSRTKTSVGKVHIGFNHYVDKVWPHVLRQASDWEGTLWGRLEWEHRRVWLTGHSLGAAMATIMAHRFAVYSSLPEPSGLFTYGSPRVGNRQFADAMNRHKFPHHRWVNDGDIVTKVPFAPWFYHCGTMHHIDPAGVITMNYERTSIWQRLGGVIRSKGLFRMLMQDVKDHSSDLYRNYLSATVV